MSDELFDYVIVGAGSAGCVLANRLSARPGVRVALIEAGRRDRKPEIHIPAAFPKLFRTVYDWNLHTEPQKHLHERELYWPRGRMLGGSSSINAQMWVRGAAVDYDGWGPGWTYADVLPYFQRAEHRGGSNVDRVYGTSGPLHIEELRSPNPLRAPFFEACAEIGLRRLPELNVPGIDGYAPTPVTQRRGRRWSTADGYLRPARRRPNLKVITSGLVRRVLLDGGRAGGVEWQDASGSVSTLRASREVILSAGAVHSPHLLQLSGIGDPAALHAAGVDVAVELPGVGQNLQDHLSCGVIKFTREPVTLVDAEKPREFLDYFSRRRGMLTSNIGEGVAFVRSSDDLEVPDIELIFAPVPFFNHGLDEPPGHGVTIGVILLQPDSSGRITLRSTDPAVPPLIEADYLDSPNDLERLLAGMAIAQRLFDTAALSQHMGAPMLPGPEHDDLSEFVRDYAETLYHPIGTCRMGTDEESVVDPDLRVRGVEGLRVVDASVIPRIIRGHTHAPTVMIAEKAADLIAG